MIANLCNWVRLSTNGKNNHCSYRGRHDRSTSWLLRENIRCGQSHLQEQRHARDQGDRNKATHSISKDVGSNLFGITILAISRLLTLRLYTALFKKFPCLAFP